MTLTIWGRLTSINVQKAMLCIEEAGVAYERIDAGLAYGINDTPGYLDMNPNGLVPTLQDGDLTLWESNAIVRYVAARYSHGGLWPDDPAERARADMWMDWQQTSLWPAMHPVFWGLVRAPGTRTPEEIEAVLGSEKPGMIVFMAEEWAKLEPRLASRVLTHPMRMGGKKLVWTEFPVPTAAPPAAGEAK